MFVLFQGLGQDWIGMEGDITINASPACEAKIPNNGIPPYSSKVPIKANKQTGLRNFYNCNSPQKKLVENKISTIPINKNTLMSLKNNDQNFKKTPQSKLKHPRRCCFTF